MYPYYNGKKLLFPIGEFTTAVCSKGLQESIKRGHCTRIRQVAYYEQDIIFKDYVDYLYPFKDEYSISGEKVMRELIKKMLNALYGKFGQKQPMIIEEYEEEFDGYWRREAYNLVTGEKGVEYKLFNTYTFEMGFEDAPLSFIAIPAHITEYARFLLWEIMEGMGWKKVLYVDTDSIKIRAKDLKHVKYPIDENEIGALKIEERFNCFEIIGPKTYSTESVTKRKGVPKSASVLDTDTFAYQSFVKQKTHMREKEDGVYIIRRITKKLSRNYDKGVVDSRGKVTPHRLFALSA